MSQETIFPQWRNEHDHSHYPFSDSASLENAEGDRIPENLFLDARVYPIGGSEEQYLSRINASTTLVSIFVASEAVELASASFDPSAPTDTLRLTDAYGRPAGVLVADPEQLALLGSWGPGDHLFTAESAAFTATAVVPTPQIGVRGVVLESGEVFVGETWFVGEEGVFVRKEGETIRVDIIGDPMAQKRYCEEHLAYVQSWFIQTINGIGPDRRGDFKLLPGSQAASDTVLRIEPITNGLTMKLVGVSR
jgi:hypothetical protein